MNRRRKTFPREFLRCATIALIVSSSLAGPRDGDPRSSGAQWIARIGDRTISVEDFARRYADFLSSTGVKDNLAVRSAVLSNMMSEVALLHFDRPAEGIAETDSMDAAERIRRRVLLAYLKDHEIFAKIRVTEREARLAFARAHEKIAARHLFARTEEEANELSGLLKSGVDFQVLASQTFTDSTLRSNGGFLGYFAWGDMDPAFEDAAYALPIGETSPPIRTAYGYSIIRVEDRLPHPLLTEQQFQQKRAHIEQVVKIRKKRPAEEEYLRTVLPSDQLFFEDNGLAGMAEEVRRQPVPAIERGKGTKLSDVCVRFRGRAYTRGEIIARLQTLPDDQKSRIVSESMVKAAIRGMILQDELLTLAQRKGFDTLEVVRDAIHQEQEAGFLRGRIEQITNERAVSDSEAMGFYQKNIQWFSAENELSVQEIVLPGKALADSIRFALEQGADFGALARRHSLRKWSAAKGGTLDFAPLSRYGQLKETLWKCSIGELVGPIAVEDCYGLFRILGKRDGRPYSFIDVRERVLRMLRREEQRTTIQDYVSRLQERVGVEINRERLASFEFRETTASH